MHIKGTQANKLAKEPDNSLQQCIHLECYPVQLALFNQLPVNTPYLLCLDIDGTLAEFQLNPKDSFIPQQTLTILQQLQQYQVIVCAITGRSLVEARQLMQPLSVPIAATHGLEFDLLIEDTAPISINQAEFNAICQEIEHACNTIPQLEKASIESKPYSIAVHFRQYPPIATLIEQMMYNVVKPYSHWQLKAGKYVWEILPADVNKGAAILTLRQKLDAFEAYPIFIGDDVTDEAGFEAVNTLNGYTIKVGEGQTVAHYRLGNVASVAQFLQHFLDFLQASQAKPTGGAGCLS